MSLKTIYENILETFSLSLSQDYEDSFRLQVEKPIRKNNPIKLGLISHK